MSEEVLSQDTVVPSQDSPFKRTDTELCSQLIAPDISVTDTAGPDLAPYLIDPTYVMVDGSIPRALPFPTRQLTLASANAMTRAFPTDPAKLEEDSRRQLARNVLDSLNKFVPGLGGAGSYMWTDSKEFEAFRRNLIPLCEAATAVLKMDPVIVDLAAPAYILGDIHGNYRDLRLFAKTFWGLGVDLCPSNILFLGDYVDRGPYSIETVAYLFAIKLIAPRRVVLLRGNHEFADINGDEDLYGEGSFKRQCNVAYGTAFGTRVFQAMNAAFTFMPLAAVVDREIFCVHGGIPRTIEQFPTRPDDRRSVIEQINQLQRPITDAEIEQDKTLLLTDLMWADPALPSEEGTLGREGYSEGFGKSARGGNTCVFGTKAVDAFLTRVGCTHIVRAHQPPQLGIQYSKGGRVVTVFSSSHYCGGFNMAAAVLVSDRKMRVIVTECSAKRTTSHITLDDSDDSSLVTIRNGRSLSPPSRPIAGSMRPRVQVPPSPPSAKIGGSPAQEARVLIRNSGTVPAQRTTPMTPADGGPVATAAVATTTTTTSVTAGTVSSSAPAVPTSPARRAINFAERAAMLGAAPSLARAKASAGAGGAAGGVGVPPAVPPRARAVGLSRPTSPRAGEEVVAGHTRGGSPRAPLTPKGDGGAGGNGFASAADGEGNSAVGGGSKRRREGEGEGEDDDADDGRTAKRRKLAPAFERSLERGNTIELQSADALSRESTPGTPGSDASPHASPQRRSRRSPPALFDTPEKRITDMECHEAL